MAANNNNIPITPAILPVASIECDIEITYTLEDNETYIRKVEVPLVECREIPLNTTADFWNCNLCGSDNPYEQPVINGDVINFQVPITNNSYGYYKGYLFDANDQIIEDVNAIQSVRIADGFNNYFLNVKINVTDVPSDCFYFKIYAWENDFDPAELSACISIKIDAGNGANEADLLCRLELEEEFGEFYSELYRKTNQECEDTVLIEGVYPNKDCKGNFYGNPQLGSDIHELKFRVPGTIEKTNYVFEELLVNNNKRSSKQTDTYLLRTHKLPPYVAEMVALAFNSKQIKVDGVSFRGGVKFEKNFEEGRMWIINTTLTTECDEIDFLC